MKESAADTRAGKSRLSSLKKAYTEVVFPAAAFFSALFFTGYYLFGLMVPRVVLRILQKMYPAAVLCHFVMLPGVLLGKKRFGQLMLLVNLGWVVLSRCLLKDYAFGVESASQWAMAFCCFYACVWVLEEKKRDLLVRLVTAEVVAVLTLWAVVGILTVLYGHSLPKFWGIALKMEGPRRKRLIALSFYGMHRNKSASFFVCGAGLCLYQCFKSRKVLWKLCTAIFLPLAYCTVVLQHGRSNYLAFSILIALTAVTLPWDRLRWWGRPAGIVCEILAVGLCAAILFASFGKCSSGLSQLALRIQTSAAQTEATESAAPETVTEPASPPQESIQIKDNRDTLEDAKTLTGRVTVWKALLSSIREDPKIGLLGQSEEIMMERICEKSKMHVYHMHNILLQQLALAGVPGMLLYILWLLSLARDMAVYFFRRKDREARTMRVLSAALLGLLAYGVFEPLMSARFPLSSILFCLMAGLLSGASARAAAE